MHQVMIINGRGNGLPINGICLSMWSVSEGRLESGSRDGLETFHGIAVRGDFEAVVVLSFPLSSPVLVPSFHLGLTKIEVLCHLGPVIDGEVLLDGELGLEKLQLTLGEGSSTPPLLPPVARSRSGRSAGPCLLRLPLELVVADIFFAARCLMI